MNVNTEENGCDVKQIVGNYHLYRYYFTGLVFLRSSLILLRIFDII